MSFSFLIVLPKDSRSAVAPLPRHSPISAGLATSKLEPFARQHRDDLRRRVGLDRVIDAGDRQIAAQQVIGLGDNVEIDDKARGLGRMFGQETCNLVVHVPGQPSAKRLSVSRC